MQVTRRAIGPVVSTIRWTLSDPGEIAQRFAESAIYLPSGRDRYRLDAEFVCTPRMSVEWMTHEGEVIAEERTKGRQVFAIVDDVRDTFEVGGVDVRANSVVATSSELHLARLRGPISYTVVNVVGDWMDVRDAPVRHLTATKAQRARLTWLIEETRRLAHDPQTCPAALLASSESIADALQAIVLSTTTDEPDVEIDLSMQIVLDAVSAMREERAATVDELLDEVPTSRSSLYRSFDRVLGVSPYAYMQRRRLIRLRRRLLEVDYEPGVVTREAANVGAFHLGNLASCYRKLFDELPHDTAARRASSAAESRQAWSISP